MPAPTPTPEEDVTPLRRSAGERLAGDRDAVVRALHAENIGAKVH